MHQEEWESQGLFFALQWHGTSHSPSTATTERCMCDQCFEPSCIVPGSVSKGRRSWLAASNRGPPYDRHGKARDGTFGERRSKGVWLVYHMDELVSKREHRKEGKEGKNSRSLIWASLFFTQYDAMNP